MALRADILDMVTFSEEIRDVAAGVQQRWKTIKVFLIDALDVVQEDLRILKVYDIENIDTEQVRMKLDELEIASLAVRDPGTARKGISIHLNITKQPKSTLIIDL